MNNKRIILSVVAVSLGALCSVVGVGTIAYAQTTIQPSTAAQIPPHLITMDNVSSSPIYPPSAISFTSSDDHSQTDNASSSPVADHAISPTIEPMPPIVPAQEDQANVSINGQGRAQLSYGQVKLVNGTIMTISVFGIDFTVDTSNAKIGVGPSLPPLPDILSMFNSSSSPFGASAITSASTSPVTVNVGDTVSLNGTVASSTGVINATTVNDLTDQAQSSNTIQTRINQLLQMLDQLRSQL